MNNYNTTHSPIDPLIRKTLTHNASLYLALGIGLLAFGFLAILYAYTATVLSVIYFGVSVITLGCFEAVKAFKLSHWSSRLLHAVLSIMYIGGGIFVALNPAVNAVTLTLLLATFFMVSGALRIGTALYYNVPHKGWFIFNGITTFILGFCIWYEWPFSGLWVIGMLLGIEAMATGWTLVMFSRTLKRIAQA